MKKFITMIALVAAMFTVNTTVANAQMNYDEVNYKIHRTHTLEYMEKGDDAYRVGKYNEAMEAYKNARYHNKFKDGTIVPPSEIDRKMDRCADAMRREENMRRVEAIAASNRSVARPVAVAARPTAATNDANALCEVTRNGLTYTTTAANTGCSIVSVKSECDYTVVEMEFINTGSRATTISINKDTFLKDRINGVKYSLREVEGIGVNASPVESGESQVFRLYFNRISNSCSEVDVIEPGTSSWKFYHVPVRR